MDTSQRLWTVPFVALTVADLAYFSAIGMAVFALPLYVTGPLGAGEAAAGLTFGVFALTALVVRPWAGRLTDAWGRRPLLLGGAGICALGMWLLPSASSVTETLAIRGLQGIGEAAFVVAGFAALADLAPAHRLGEALSLNSLGLYLGLALGPLLAEAVIVGRGFTAAWVVAGVLALTAFGGVALVGETRTPRSGDRAEPPAQLIHRAAVPICVGFFTALLAIGGFLAFASLHGGAIGMANASTALFVFGATVVLGRVLFARVPDRYPPLSLAAVALLVITIGLLVVSWWATPTGFLIGVVVLAVGVVFSTPAFFTAVFRTAGPSERGAASATASIAVDAGLGAGPIMLGLVAQAAGVRSAFAVGALVALLGAAWVLALRAGAARRTVS